ANQMLDELCRLYPDANCELVYDSTFQFLISVIMSAQTTDTQVNKVTPELFARYPEAGDLAEAPLAEIKAIIRPTGYFNAKATNITNCARALLERFDGQVPRTLEELTSLPGVGRKTANVVLGVAFSVPGWTVDTHVQRLSKRLGLSQNTDPHKIEKDLQKLFPKKRLDQTFNHYDLAWSQALLCPQARLWPMPDKSTLSRLSALASKDEQ
ncbi:MAG: endonuclease III, partial [Candidatus Obscuribacterales bacterium]|nr:endonuclease III [Candidatus Obscuribacterales bacterium]